MNRYLKLVHYELFRVRKLYAALLVLTVIVQFAGMYVYAFSFLSFAKETMLREGLSLAAFAAKYTPNSYLQYVRNGLFPIPIAVSAAVLFIYVFLIWYRDWFGKNMFIYRLLMIPASRMNIYLAKLSAIILLVLGLVAFELLIMRLQLAAFTGVMPQELRHYTNTTVEVVMASPQLSLITPDRPLDFILYYIAGAAGVIVIFTAILIERSYRFKGAILAILYGAAAGFVLILPLMISEGAYPGYLYPQELFALELALGILIAGGSLKLSHFLITNKVTV